jgi:putative ATP-dependent endonuclease of OLD family
MKLDKLRLFNFQSYGSAPTELSFDELTFLIGPNGSGKTATLQALCRMFGFDPSLRRVKKSDFHVPNDELEIPDERTLWVEVDFIFPELLEDNDNCTVAPHFGHMRLVDGEDIPRVRFRLEASMGIDGDIEDSLLYVLELDENQQPSSTAKVPRTDRNHIQIHYLPARRDPAEHITFGAHTLLGRMLRAVNWEAEREVVKSHTDHITTSLAANTSVNALSASIQSTWLNLHKGQFFTQPKITFIANEIESLLRHLSISFSPGHDEANIDYSRLSDGQKSMLYLSLVLSSQVIGRAVLNGENTFDPDKLRPAIFTLVAMEEPENSLSPHYLGRIVTSLQSMTGQGDAQAIIATHAPSMLRRIEPNQIRYLRLNSDRKTTITSIILPNEEHSGDAHKFVTQAVKAFPEVYFSRLVVLGEGDSEEIVIPMLLEAKGVPIDAFGITVAPLGGRHVNHFWRLLEGLGIPHITLLDLDVGRYQGGWGRIKTSNDQIIKYRPDQQLADNFVYIPEWDHDEHKVRKYSGHLTELEKRNVFFSYPLDLDFTMLNAFPLAFGIKEGDQVAPETSNIKAVLGKSREDASEYTEEEKKLFITYHKLFKLGSKPAEHITALSKLTKEQLIANMPPELDRLVEAIKLRVEGLPE